MARAQIQVVARSTSGSNGYAEQRCELAGCQWKMESVRGAAWKGFWYRYLFQIGGEGWHPCPLAASQCCYALTTKAPSSQRIPTCSPRRRRGQHTFLARQGSSRFQAMRDTAESISGRPSLPAETFIVLGPVLFSSVQFCSVLFCSVQCGHAAHSLGLPADVMPLQWTAAMHCSVLAPRDVLK